MKTNRTFEGVAALAACMLLAGPALAVTIEVPADHATIQAAIAAATDGDQVVVAPGTYVEAIDFLGKSIAVRSASADPGDTTIDGNGALHVVKCVTGEGPGTLLTGFTVTGGNAAGAGGDAHGGGMLVSDSRMRVSNCVFEENNGTIGGGIHVRGAAHAEVVNSDFINNTAAFGAGLINEAGGEVTVTNCRFLGNSANSGSEQGGGAYLNGVVQMSNCVFSGNSAFEGAAIRVFNGSPIISNCTFASNPGGFGSLRHSGGGSSSLTNCIFASGTTFSGASYVVSSSLFGDALPAGVIDGGGNITSTDPLFVDADGADNTVGTADDDLRVQSCSPAVDAGSAALLAPDLADVDGDDDTAESAPLDLDRADRIARIDLDMGAYEAPGVPGDTNGDGNVGFADLTFILIHWGGCQ